MTSSLAIKSASTKVWLLGLLTALSTNCFAADWLPIDPADLKMTSEPKAPSAPAIYLYRQVDRDDSYPAEDVYVRIKILKDEGRKFADVQIPYAKGSGNIRGIEARTIRPDGSTVDFDGEIFDRPLVEARGSKLIAKTFTLPDVQVGGIIEYKYRRILQSGYVFDSHWILSEELYTRHAKFSLLPYPYFSLTYSWPLGLPTGTASPAKDKNRIRLETRDVPAFVSEDFMPPEDQMKMRVDFIYYPEEYTTKNEVEFWKKVAKLRTKEVDAYINNRRAMEQAVAETIAPGDSPETKLRKLYTRVQQLRNLSYERAKSEEETKREGQKEVRNVADVWKRGYGDGTQLTWLYLALVRAAGFEADPVLVATRDRFIFSERLMNPSQLNSNVVWVKSEGKEYYLDPGIPFTPFGLLPWFETGVKGLRLTASGGVWTATPLPQAEVSQVLRKANLKLSTNGTLSGKIVVTYTGLEALSLRMSERHDDGTERKEVLENKLEYSIPSGITVTLTNEPKWDEVDTPLIAEYDVTVPGWASGAGQRLLVPQGLFSQKEKRLFESASRIHPLYHFYPYNSIDDISVELPDGWQVGSVPQPVKNDSNVLSYNTSSIEKDRTLQIRRDLKMNFMFLDKKYYPAVRDFYQTVRTQDAQQVMLQRVAPQPIKPPQKR